MMINNNQNFNDNVNNLFNKKINNINKIEKEDNKENKNLNTIQNTNLNYKNNDKKNENIDINETDNNNNEIKKFTYYEVNKIKQEKSIFNMIVLHTGNIATSSIGSVTIYNANNLLSKNEEDYLLQKINISKTKKIGYVFEFPDETIFCATHSKIFHLKLIDNDKKYIILGILKLGRYEIPTKLISLGNLFLAALTVDNGISFIRLFIKEKEFKNINYNNDQLKDNNNKEKGNNINNNLNDQSPAILNDIIDYLDKKNIIIDKEFCLYNDNI